MMCINPVRGCHVLLLIRCRLGLKLEEQLEVLDAEAGMPPRIAARWAATEARRSALQWQPSRPGSSAAGGGLGFRQEMPDRQALDEPARLACLAVAALLQSSCPLPKK